MNSRARTTSFWHSRARTLSGMLSDVAEKGKEGGGGGSHHSRVSVQTVALPGPWLDANELTVPCFGDALRQLECTE